MTATFWVRDDDASTVSVELDRLSQLAARHELNIGLAAIPGKLDRSLVDFVDSERLHFHPMCHGWQHVNYNGKGKPAEFGADRPQSALVEDGRLAFEAFAEHFGRVGVVFVPPFGRITDAMVDVLPEIGFVGVSKGPSAMERWMTRVAWAPSPVRLPTRKSVPHFDVHIDPIDWRRMTARDAAAVGAEIVGHLRLRRNGFVSSDLPIGILTHHLAHDDAVWALCDDLFGALRHEAAAAFAPASHVITGRDGKRSLRENAKN
jgi:peptidoglycan/xylan/chitin deacetylase (PgdA/CDA1 family)